MTGKIALEEHVTFPGFEDLTPVGAIPPELYESHRAALRDVDGARREELEATGVMMTVLSLTAPGIQGVGDPAVAVRRARQANDALAEMLVGREDRCRGFAAVPLQDPPAAAAELERSVTELGFRGALINGYSDLAGGVEYGDAERVLPFWERAEALGVPVYLHPRLPVAGTPLFAGRPELAGPVWAFGVETATHAARLIVSGLFDRFPRLVVIVGHLGEGLPHQAWRIEHWLAKNGLAPRLRRRFREYLRANFFLTTSGCFHTPALRNALEEVGPERVLYSVDSPYESLREGAEWFDSAPLDEAARERIAHANAARLLGISPTAPT